MIFVDRKDEMQWLQKTIAMEKSALIVVYGRRRLGKSTLVQRVLTPGKDVYFQADETQTANQLILLSKAIATAIPGFDRVSYPDWTSILEALNYRVTEPITLCLDEFPYLVKSFNPLPSVIQRFWDTMSPKFNLILCGSSQQSMYSDVLNATSPLYGRADCILKLRPLHIQYIQEAMELSYAKDAVIHYSFWGGVPRYWTLAMEEGSFENALRHLVLSPEGILTDEPNRLLRDDLRDLTLSRTLLSVIGNGANRMSEIAARVGKNASELTGPIHRLIDMGYLERELPFGEEPKNGKRSLYRICDPFLDAYYHFVAPNASLIGMGQGDFVWNQIGKEINGYVGTHWEHLCRAAVSGKVVGEVRYGIASRWWGNVNNPLNKTGRQMELDVVALSEDKKHLLVGECKWTAPEYADRLLTELKEKAMQLPFAKNVEHIHPVLFLREKPLDDVARESIFFPEDVVKRY